MKAIDMTGKITIVTGAGGCIGGGIAKVFAEAGSKVYVVDLNLEAAEKMVSEIRKTGGNASPVALDVTDVAAINAAVDKIAAEEGHIDVLVNVAGMIVSRPYMEATKEDMTKTMDINLVSVDSMCRSVLRYMIPKRSGKIVNVISIAARHGGDLLAQYSASKFAEMGLTQSIALAVSKYNINVNGICPGFIMTPIQMVLLEARGKEDGKTIEEMIEVQNSRVPLGRWQTPEDMGNACLFLASEWAANITGQALNVDGGVRLN